MFAAVAKTDTAIKALIQRSLTAVGQTVDPEIIAFSDGCPGLRAIFSWRSQGYPALHGF